MGHGISLSELEHILSDEGLSHKATAEQSRAVETHLNSANWFVECDRNKAIDMLQNRADGTFLIRPGSQDNPFSLSIV